MTLSDLFIVCSHGRRSAHGIGAVRSNEAGFVIDPTAEGWCQGGRPATLEDLGGEKVWWCEVHRALGDDSYCSEVAEGHVRPGDCDITERILIPLPQMVAE